MRTADTTLYMGKGGVVITLETENTTGRGRVCGREPGLQQTKQGIMRAR